MPYPADKTTDQLTAPSPRQYILAALAYLNASQNCVHLLSVPAVLTVPFAEEETSLARCYAVAGPARCREALAQVLALPEGTRYPGLFSRCAGAHYQPVRAGAGIKPAHLTEENLPAMAQPGRAGHFRRGRARILVPAAGRPKPFHQYVPQRPALPCGMRFSGRILDLLPATLPDALRASSSALLTDLTALDYDALERTLEFLANNSAAVAAQALPGQWNAASSTCSHGCFPRCHADLFQCSPTEAQASSFNEP